MGYRLIDLLDAIYWDISFYGGPAEAKEFGEELSQFGEELSQRVEGIKEALDRGEDAGLIPLEDILKEEEEEKEE
jgi:hypothetical protein